MKRVQRPTLPGSVASYITRQSEKLRLDLLQGSVDIDKRWKARRQTKAVGQALRALQAAMGSTEPCMYCVDNHGTDIEHFWPKSQYLDKVFDWTNWLLCCTECGRIKNTQFPLDSQSQPLLIDPTREDPWTYLDFEPVTGNLVARFDLSTQGWMAKGEETVRVLLLSSRESLSERYRRTYRRLCVVAQEIIDMPNLSAAEAAQRVISADDHGQLLSWCLHGAGQSQAPFSLLRTARPDIWGMCLDHLG
jgi:uncharacterized protein (TIGR02646 family)